MNTHRPPRLEDVARQAGVSTATISRALNDPDKVAKATRDKIEDAINALGYTPNFSGRSLASSRSTTVAAIVPSLANAMFASGLQAFEEVLSEEGITLLIATTNYDPVKELHQIRATMANGADGVLLIGRDRLDETREFLAKRKVPHVIGWAWDDDPGTLYAGFDNQAAAAHATQRVLELGHRRIAMIAGVTTGNDRARGRLLGVRTAIARWGEGARLTHVVECPYRLELGGDAFAQIMTGAEPPTAILCGNDVLAAGAILRARLMGVAVPGKVSVVGYDDIGLASVVSPALTTVRVPQIEMGQEAARLLLALRDGSADLRSVKLPTEWIERESLGPVPRPA